MAPPAAQFLIRSQDGARFLLKKGFRNAILPWILIQTTYCTVRYSYRQLNLNNDPSPAQSEEILWRCMLLVLFDNS